MGRRAYDFTEEDVAALNHVATLRKFGFTVEEIRLILADPQESVAIVAAVRARKEETVRQEGENLDALSRLEAEKAYTVAELATALVDPVREAPVPSEYKRIDWKILAGHSAWYAAVLLVGGLPVVWLAEGILSGLQSWHYPVFVPDLFARNVLLILLPTLVLGLMWMLKKRRPGRRTWRAYLALGLCMLYLPFSLFCAAFLLSASETEDPWHYRQLDADCQLNNDPLFQALFPARNAWEVDKYHYFCTTAIFPGYEVYAEWTLPPKELAVEVERVKQLFDRKQDAPLFLPERDISFQQGDFTCLVYPDGKRVNTLAEPSAYRLMAFAYNEQTGQVRYIAYYGGYDPYYTQQDWGVEGVAD
jgi:DNA-binding transcriptional MerR regulator